MAWCDTLCNGRWLPAGEQAPGLSPGPSVSGGGCPSVGEYLSVRGEHPKNVV